LLIFVYQPQRTILIFPTSLTIHRRVILAVSKMLSRLPVFLFPLLSLANPLSPEAAVAGANKVGAQQGTANTAAAGKPSTEGKTTFDGVSLAAIPQGQPKAAIVSSAISRNGWTVQCDSFQPGYECANAIDGSNNTFWHTQWNPTVAPLPHYIIIDMKQSYLVGGITYDPRQDGSSNGNIGQHTVSLRYEVVR